MKVGRNEPCPCGSGLKYKRCCLAKEEASPRFTREEREAALAKLERFSMDVGGEEDDDALYELWGDEERGLGDEGFDDMSEAFGDMWFWFDRKLDDGRLVVDRLLGEDDSITPGERRFLEAARATSMRLWEVVDVRPGASVTLADVLDGTRVTVHERLASRSMTRGSLVVARIIPRGVSGQPEMERGVLGLPPLMREAVVSQLRRARAEWRHERPHAGDDDFYKEMGPFFHSAWTRAILDPPIPKLFNTDGEELLVTRTHFDVHDAAAIEPLLDGGDGLSRHPERKEWSWTGRNAKGEEVSLGRLVLDGTTLVLETNSVARAERGRKLVETLAGDRVAYRATSHEDLTAAIKEGLRSRAGKDEPEPVEERLPPGVLEDLMLDHHARYYRKWLDDSIPALGGKTPREAAKVSADRPKVEELIRGLEGMYERALTSGQPAYDPSWMWAELGLADDGPKHPPLLAHERWAQAVPGWQELSRGAAERGRAEPGFDAATGLVPRAALEANLEIRRLLAGRPGDARKLEATVNFELHRRKTFWVDEALAYLLAETDLDVLGELVRVPFASFALVFTDRQTLSLAERLLATERAGTPHAGHMLRVITVYVAETSRDSDGTDRTLHLGLAPDTLGADPPDLLEHRVELRAGVKVQVASDPPTKVVVEGEEVALPSRRPLPGLLHVILNAILYATSAGVTPEVRPSPRVRRSSTSASAVFTSEDVHYLPGNIEISHLRQLQALDRAPSGRQLLHRFMVRGHWRRAAKDWKDQAPRWIKPYWKGPDLAAIIERTYKLTE